MGAVGHAERFPQLGEFPVHRAAGVAEFLGQIDDRSTRRDPFEQTPLRLVERQRRTLANSTPPVAPKSTGPDNSNRAGSPLSLVQMSQQSGTYVPEVDTHAPHCPPKLSLCTPTAAPRPNQIGETTCSTQSTPEPVGSATAYAGQLASSITAAAVATSAVTADAQADTGEAVDIAVASYASDYGVTNQEAQRRLDRIQPPQELMASIRGLEAARLAGWGIDHTGTFTGWVWLTGDQPPTADAASIADTHTDVQIRTGATHTLTELLAAQTGMFRGAARPFTVD